MMISFADPNLGVNMNRSRDGDGGDLSPPPFREPRLLPLFGRRRSDESQRLAAEMAETWIEHEEMGMSVPVAR
jgi:hypothetical protein